MFRRQFTEILNYSNNFFVYSLVQACVTKIIFMNMLAINIQNWRCRQNQLIFMIRRFAYYLRRNVFIGLLKRLTHSRSRVIANWFYIGKWRCNLYIEFQSI